MMYMQRIHALLIFMTCIIGSSFVKGYHVGRYDDELGALLAARSGVGYSDSTGADARLIEVLTRSATKQQEEAARQRQLINACIQELSTDQNNSDLAADLERMVEQVGYVQSDDAFAKLKKTLESKYHDCPDKALRDTLRDLDDRMHTLYLTEKLKQNVQGKLMSLSRNLSLKDIAMRGFVGNNWHALQGYNPETFGETVAAVTLFSTAGVLNKKFEQAIDRSFGGFIDSAIYGTYSTLSYYFKELYYKTRNMLSGRAGRPLQAEVVCCWQESVNTVLSSLLKIAKDASRMGARHSGQVLREDDAEQLEDAWQVIIASDIAELSYVTYAINQALQYYDRKSSGTVVHYAQQLNRLLSGLHETILAKAKSYRDIGTGDLQVALERAQISVSQYFKLLLRQIDQSAMGRDTSSSSMMTKRTIGGGSSSSSGMSGRTDSPFGL